MYTYSDWIREKLESMGENWVRENYQACCLDFNGKPPVPESYFRMVRKALGDSRKLPEIESDVATVTDAIDFHNVDLSRMRITGARVNTWGSEQNPNKQVRLELKPVEMTPEDLLADFREAVADYKIPPMAAIQPRSASGYMLEVNVPDLHFGQLSWGQETNHGDYDMGIAGEIFMKTVRLS